MHAAWDLKGFHAKTGSLGLESSQLNSFGTGAGMQNDDCCWPPSKWKKCISWATNVKYADKTPKSSHKSETKQKHKKLYKKEKSFRKKSLARRRGDCSGRFYANFLTHNRRKDSTGEISETTGRYRFIIILSWPTRHKHTCYCFACERPSPSITSVALVLHTRQNTNATLRFKDNANPHFKFVN